MRTPYPEPLVREPVSADFVWYGVYLHSSRTRTEAAVKAPGEYRKSLRG